MDEIRENDVVALLVDHPEVSLRRGDVGTVVQVFDVTSHHGGGVMVEFIDDFGRTLSQLDVTDLNHIVKLRFKPNREAA